MGWPKLQWIEVSHCDKLSIILSDLSVYEQSVHFRSECHNRKTLQGQSVTVVNITGAKCHSCETLQGQSVTVVKHYRVEM
jgi:hypothetical protein